MAFSDELSKSVSQFRILIQIDSKDTLYAGRFSFDAFTPIGSAVPYEGRLLSAPKISINRDSNQFGILVFSSSGFTLNNADGEFDQLLVNYNVIGATVRVWIGYDNIDISTYVNIYTGYVETININENQASFSISDSRKRLKTGNSTDISFVDAVQGIENILLGNYTITAGSTYFDVTAMTAAKALAYDVVRIAPDNDTVDAAIEDCVKSTMGFFFIDGTGKYSYKMVDTAATSVSTINRYDIINNTSINYNESGIIASVSVESPKQEWGIIGTVTSTIGNIMVVLSNGYILSGAYGTPGGIYRSTDRFSSWSVVKTFGAGAEGVDQFVPLRTGTVLALTSNRTNTTDASSESIYRSTDSGSSWSNVQTLARHKCGVFNTSIETIIAVYSGNDGVTATSTAIWQSLDNGSSFSGIAASGVSGKLIYQMVYSTTDSCIYAIAQDSNGFETQATVFSVMRSTTGSAWTTLRTVSTAYSSGSVFAHAIAVWGEYLVVGYVDHSAYGGSPLSTMSIQISRDNKATYATVASYEISASPIFFYHFPLANIDFAMKIDFDVGGGLYYSVYNNGLFIAEASSINADSIVPALIRRAIKNPAEFVLDKYNGLLYTVDYDWVNSSLDVAIKSKMDIGYLWALNTSYKASTYSQYGIDTLKHFNTVFAYYSDAQLLGTDLIEYFKDLHGNLSITTPMKYYTVNIGDNVDVQIWRETTSFLGT
ncbi:hypothetical protein M0R04_15905, partial [Candidatus Dojkabacteria bacterium]|nr:hypothetical protein [Candidatus Dojkabacteria bacterium]